MLFSDIKAQQLGYIITAKQFRGAPKLGYSWYQKAKASDQPLHFFAFFGALPPKKCRKTHQQNMMITNKVKGTMRMCNEFKGHLYKEYRKT